MFCCFFVCLFKSKDFFDFSLKDKYESVVVGSYVVEWMRLLLWRNFFVC